MQHTATDTRGSSVAIDETDRLIASNKVQGTPVYNRQGEHLGEVYNFMVDKYSGQVAYALGIRKPCRLADPGCSGIALPDRGRRSAHRPKQVDVWSKMPSGRALTVADPALSARNWTPWRPR
jgi:PRC-barrel domain